MIIRKQKTNIDHTTTCAEMRIRMKKMYRICMVTLLFMIAVGSIQLKNDMISAASNKKAAKPKLTVPLSKVSLEGARLQRDANGHMIYTASVRNRSKKGTIKKIEYIYSAKVEQPSPTVETGDVSVRIKRKNVTLTAKRIKPGKVSKPVSCSGDESGEISAMKLKKVRLYAGTAMYTYNLETKKGRIRWGTKDKKPPVISGWTGKNSFCGKEPFLTCYSDWKDHFDFTKYVKASDKRDGPVKVSVDTSRINWEKDGIYKVKYTAVDKAGNKATAWAKIQIFVTGTAEQIADSALASITEKNWSDEKKCRAIYQYVQKRCTYVGTGPHSNWRAAAVKGLRYQSGDCYTYYSMAKLLLTRAGIPNITVTRYPSYDGYRHWWNLTWVKNGWYHIDTTPRPNRPNFCLMTDAQLQHFSSGSTFRYQTKQYPKRATKKISKNPQKKE